MDLIYKPGDVLTGSNKLTDIEKETISREEYMVLHASENKAIEFYKEKFGKSKAVDLIVVAIYLNLAKDTVIDTCSSRLTTLKVTVTRMSLLSGIAIASTSST